MASKFPPRMAPECLNIYSGAFKKMDHPAGKVDWIRSGDFPKRTHTKYLAETYCDIYNYG